ARMVEKNPSILNYGFDNIDGKLSGLKARGFEKPERLVEKFSAIFAYGFDNIDGKLSGLKARGFTKPTKIVERSPSILAYSFENIDEKLKRLREMGFAEPVRLVEKFPGILSLSLDNINDKLKGLKTRGFDKPVKLVERKPVIVGLNFKNIDWKMKMLSRLISLYNLPFTVTGMMERHTAFFGIKNDKLRILTRIAKEASHRLEEVDNGLIKQLLFANLEDEIIASRQKPGMNPKELLFAIGTVKKRQLSREEKREIIETLPKEDKVKRRYFRGYPK
ncbi:hypothetical protein HZA44_01495, partial [Candidatus Peregrinibacteria bacterium]|nr:hypothetical protein [Candidatus Peregrinibacteria bacterium]